VSAAPATPVQPPGELAQRLYADKSGELASEWRRHFETARLAAKRKLHEPLSPEEFAIHAAIAEGAELCAEVIGSVWDSMHPR
jgi:hypothetical protein